MGRPIGYYVHHQGDGHRQRALAIARASGGGLTLLGTGLAGRTGDIPYVDMADDRLEEGCFDDAAQVKRHASLHYTPVDHEGIRTRIAQLTEWIAQNRPSLIVVDVSVEIAMLAHLASVPFVYVRLSGRRDDRPHLDAFRGATALLAPFHEDLDDEQTHPLIRLRTFYAPGIVEAREASEVERDLILVVVGRGGGSSDGGVWAAAAASVPDMRWRVIGPCSSPPESPPNLELRGWVHDADEMIATAAIVIGAAGDGLVGSVIAHRKPFICLPEERPFQEQISKARRLSALGAAIVCTDGPSSVHWPAALRQVPALAPARLARLACPLGAERVARWLSVRANEASALRSQSV
jgi:hypothetical protein